MSDCAMHVSYNIERISLDSQKALLSKKSDEAWYEGKVYRNHSKKHYSQIYTNHLKSYYVKYHNYNQECSERDVGHSYIIHDDISKQSSLTLIALHVIGIWRDEVVHSIVQYCQSLCIYTRQSTTGSLGCLSGFIFLVSDIRWCWVSCATVHF